ncbi:helix-turn-helix domain-containing protein [Anaerosolibacter sp.]|uniref:helix-turn-helix domain-containing protein n=1 Tax=Anaerosolibacter sp. TaxID=1872527 RepID=UPI0039EF2305
MNISERLKYLRKLNKLSQDDVSEHIGASRGNISDWERGRSKPGADALRELSRFYKVSIDWLVTGEGRGPDESDNPDVARVLPGQVSIDDIFASEDFKPLVLPPGMSLFDYFNSITDSLFTDPEQAMTPEQKSKIIYLADKLQSIVKDDEPEKLDQPDHSEPITEKQIPLFQRIGRALIKTIAKKPSKDIDEMIEEMIARDGYALIDIEKDMPELFKEVQAIEAAVKSLELKETIKLLKKLPYAEVKEVKSFIDYRLSRIEQSGPQEGRSSNYQNGEEAASLDKAIG